MARPLTNDEVWDEVSRVIHRCLDLKEQFTDEKELWIHFKAQWTDSWNFRSRTSATVPLPYLPLGWC